MPNPSNGGYGTHEHPPPHPGCGLAFQGTLQHSGKLPCTARRLKHSWTPTACIASTLQTRSRHYGNRQHAGLFWIWIYIPSQSQHAPRIRPFDHFGPGAEGSRQASFPAQGCRHRQG